MDIGKITKRWDELAEKGWLNLTEQEREEVASLSKELCEFERMGREEAERDKKENEKRRKIGIPEY